MIAVTGWDEKPLIQLLTLILDFRGKTPKKLGMEWGNGDIPALSANNVEMGKIDLTKECYFGTDALYRKWMTRGDTRAGDIVLTTEAPLGNVAQIPDERRYILSQRTILLRADETRLCNSYLRHYISSDEFQTLMRQQSSGTTATGIQRAKLEPLTIRFPVSTLEQEEIARILDTVDLAIEKTNALFAKQRQLKAGLTHDLLTRGIDKAGNVRSFQSHKFKDSSLGKIPVEWQVRTFSEILNERGGHIQTGPFGSQLHSYEYVSDGIPVIMPQDISDGEILETHIARITEEKAVSLSRHRVIPGDLIFARRGDLSRCAVITEHQRGWLCGTGCLLMRPPTKALLPYWTAQVYRFSQIQSQVAINAVGSTMPNLNTGIIAALAIGYVHIDEQAQIVEHLNSLDTVMQKTRNVRDKLISLKTALMQDLLTGKKRVTGLCQSAAFLAAEAV